MTLAIETRGLCKEYPGGAGLHGIDLAVPVGATYGLIGPNGAGKTTMLSLLAGLRRSDAGDVQFAVPADKVAICPDTPEFEPWLTAREILRLACTLSGAPPDAERIDAALHETGIDDAGDRRVGGFSRGMTQRLAIATTLVAEPAIVILDEPTSALDPIGRHELLDLIANLGRDRTVLLSSHILADVQRVCDTVGVLINGRLRYQGTIDGLLAEHLRPVWTVRVRGDAEAVVAALRAKDWVRDATVDRESQVRVQVTSFAAGESHLVAALAEIGVPVIALEPAADDLEEAFLRLTGHADTEAEPS